MPCARHLSCCIVAFLSCQRVDRLLAVKNPPTSSAAERLPRKTAPLLTNTLVFYLSPSYLLLRSFLLVVMPRSSSAPVSLPARTRRLHVTAFESRARLASDEADASWSVGRRGGFASVLALVAALLSLIAALLVVRWGGGSGGPAEAGPGAAGRGAGAAVGGRLDACSVLCGHAEPLRVLAMRHVLGPGVDSKALVDMPLAADPEDVLAAWAARWPAGAAASAPLEELRAFVAEHLLPAGADTEPVVPSDWSASPPALRTLANASLRVFALQLCDGFVQLARRVRPGVRAQPQRYTLEWLPHLLVVPGGRFLETYSWDSFWIIEGLQLCGMQATARGVLLNLVYFVDRHGLLPNGGRTYYAHLGGRSQPPLLTSMVRAVESAVDGGEDDALVATVWPALVRDHAYWITAPHAVSVGEHTLSRYATRQEVPRPESYVEDVATAAEAGHSDLTTPEARRLLADIAAAAESGWDFSRRWFANATLASCRTSAIVPVELNALLYRAEGDLAGFARRLAAATRACASSAAATVLPPPAVCAALSALLPALDDQAAAFDAEAAAFETAQKHRGAAIEALMWDETAGSWHDLLISHGGAERLQPPPGVASLSSWAPLIFQAPVPNASRTMRLLTSLLASNLVQDGGVRATTHGGGEQWDAANAWAPLQQATVFGLLATEVAAAEALAGEIARRWTRSSLISYEEDGYIHEKMSAASAGFSGGGGEYAPQTGFGWSNGVLLTFLSVFNWTSLE